MSESPGDQRSEHIQGRFGRRIFLSLLLVTTLPFCGFALVSYLELRSILVAQSETIQHEKLRDTGSVVVDELEAVEKQLMLFGQSTSTVDYLTASSVNIAGLSRMQLRGNLETENLLLNYLGGSALNAADLSDHFASGKGALFLDETRSSAQMKYAVRINNEVLLATVSLKQRLERLSKWADYFVVSASGKLIESSIDVDSFEWVTRLSSPKSENHFTAESDGTVWEYRFALLFLKQRFGAEGVYVVARVDSAATLQSLNRYKWIFISSLILILILISLLSALQIRRKLKPMQQLVDAANAIADKRFDFVLDKNMKGELGVLARTIGDMSSELENQFRYLKLLSDFDNYTLSDVETTTVVVDIARDLRGVFSCNYIGVLFVNQVEDNIVILVEAIDTVDQPTVKVLKTVTNKALNNLSAPLNDVVAVRRELADVLGDSIPKDVEQLNVQLMMNQNAVCGVLMLSCFGDSLDEERRTMRELAAHISVALNAKMRERSHRRHALWDSLTKAPNRRFFEQQLAQAIKASREFSNMGAVFFIDLDHFKKVNDTLGHEFGDELLRAAYLRLADIVPEGAVCARFGGDEFVLLLPTYGILSELSTLADKLIKSIADAFVIREHTVYVGASIGISCFPEHGQSADELLRCADLAMYESKRTGRNCYNIYSTATDNHFRERAKLEEALRHAMENQEFTVYYQPQVCCESGLIVGVEALARWQSPSLGWVSPGVFIPVAEDIGLIENIGDWIFEKSCQDVIDVHRKTGHMLRLGVNFSAIQFSRPKVYEKIIGTLLQCDFPPAYFDIELTESVVMEDFQHVVLTMNKLMEDGIAISLDDFGTGYSSLSYLHKIPISTVKIDRAFISDINMDEQKAALVRAIAAMNRSLGLKTLAEGVETEAEWRWLQSEQCDEIQGYYFSRPLPLEELIDYVNACLEKPGKQALT